MTLSFKDRVQQLLADAHDEMDQWKSDAAVVATSSDETAKSSALSREAMLDQVLGVLADTIDSVEELDDGPPLQDETELAHNELDLHDVPRTPDGQTSALPLWFRIKKLVERDGPPSLQKTLKSAGESPHIHVPTGKRFPTEMVAGILDSVFNQDERPLATFAAKLMSKAKACETCDHFYDASLDECPNPDCPAEYVTDELEELEPVKRRGRYNPSKLPTKDDIAKATALFEEMSDDELAPLADAGHPLAIQVRTRRAEKPLEDDGAS